MPSYSNFASRLTLAVSALLCGVIAAENANAAKVDFEKEIKPIFAAHCLSCHDEENEEGGFLIDRETTLNYVVVGDADSSDFFMHLVSDDDDMLMPPPDAENPLSQKQISLVRTWINEGAEWPEAVTIEDGESTDDSDVAIATDAAADDQQADATEITPELIKNASGSLHPAAVHLPIGLLLVSGLFAFLSLRGNFVMSDCAYYCLWIGALGSIGACVTGWFYSPMEHQGDVVALADLWDTTQDVFLHRTWALGCSIAALFLAMMAMSTRARDPDDGVLWKLGTILLAAAIGWVGHMGGELTYGKAHYKELNTLMNSIVPALSEIGMGNDEETAETTDESEAEGDTEADSDSNDESSSTDEPKDSTSGAADSPEADAT